VLLTLIQLFLITDSTEDIASIINSANEFGVIYVSGALLRLRYDIWERIKNFLQTFKIDNAIKFYGKIYKFTNPINFKKKSRC
jgi:hypothetical protein